MARGKVVALLGAESTGKTTLASALRDALVADGHDAVVVSEYLREFCVDSSRAPTREEQRAIADEQTLRIANAADMHEIVIADTSALMVAVYSEHVFADTALYADALAVQATYDLTLLTALDLPWLADGLQREGPHVREPIDACIRRALLDKRLPFSIVAGRGDARLQSALAAVKHLSTPSTAKSPKWHWICDRCGDTDCERHLLPLPLGEGRGEGCGAD